MSGLILPRNVKREERTELPEDTGSAKESKYSLERAGRLNTQYNSVYLGSAAVHYYVKQILGNKHEYQVICQLIGFDNIPEGFADYGHKELQKALMKKFGRSRKERT